MVTDIGPVPTQKSSKEEIISYLQAKGVEINPNAHRTSLLSQATKMSVGSIIPVQGSASTSSNIQIPFVPQDTENTDMKKLMGMMSQVISKVDTLDKRMTSVETSGKGDFKLAVKEADVQSASESKKNIDQRIVKIVEDVLGVDFGVEVTPNPNSPGFLFSVLVPERLSEVKRTTRPIKDETTGEYKLNEKKVVVEEEYWPGDRRSRSIGSTDSFDVIRDQCNRVRSYIISYYSKNKLPVPDFKLK